MLPSQFALLLFSLPLALAAPVDVLNLVNAKYIPVSVLSSGNTSADKIQISQVGEGGATDAEDQPLLEELLHHLTGGASVQN